jgi:DNA-binding Lrp family transcriptional regulator
MFDLDDTDRALIAALKRDGRVAATQLARQLNLSRATVQARIERLKDRGVIKRFTVEVTLASEEDAIAAIMFIALQGAMSRAVIRQLRKMPEIVTLNSTNGGWDLVARIEAQDLRRFDRVLREVREIEGVVNSETCLLLAEA